MTDEAREIVQHFTSHMPLAVRATFEAKVIETLADARASQDDDETQAMRVCVDVMWMLWEQARSSYVRA